MLEQSKSAYNSEMELMHILRDRVSFVSGILVTPISTTAILIVSTYKGSYQSCINIILFWIPVSVVIILSLISLYFIFSVLSKKHSYELQLFPSQILDYYLGGTDSEEAIYDTKYMYLKSLNEAVNINNSVNKSRLNKILNAQRAAIFSVPLLLLSFPNYFYFSKAAKPETLSVEIINFKEAKEVFMSNSTDNTTQDPPPQQPITQPQPILPEPSRPVPTRSVLFDSTTYVEQHIDDTKKTPNERN